MKPSRFRRQCNKAHTSSISMRSPAISLVGAGLFCCKSWLEINVTDSYQRHIFDLPPHPGFQWHFPGFIGIQPGNIPGEALGAGCGVDTSPFPLTTWNTHQLISPFPLSPNSKQGSPKLEDWRTHTICSVPLWLGWWIGILTACYNPL